MKHLIIITSPDAFPNETTVCNNLFFNGLQTLHLRKPLFSEAEYEQFVTEIDPRFRNRIVIHNCFHLVKKYGLKGVHLSGEKQKNFTSKPEYQQISVSCHSLQEIEQLPFHADYCFLSPIYDSISKESYKSQFSKDELARKLPHLQTPVVALGGIDAGNINQTLNLGFSGVAVLGAIWNNANSDEAIQRWRELKTPKALSIAGFDPSSGAGITSDLKTMEATGCYALGVCSGITFQNQDELMEINWMPVDEIIRQCEILFQKNNPAFVKIGIVENLSILNKLCDFLLEKLPAVRIIWDPVLQSSSGYVLHSDLSLLITLLEKIYLITPNTPELHQLFGESVSLEDLTEISAQFNVNILWKGGHNSGKVLEDILVTPAQTHVFPILKEKTNKHGTGCVLSSAITSFLAQGYALPEACAQAQVYVSEFIHSSDSNLGIHPRTEVLKPLISDIKLMYITDPDTRVSIAQQAEAACRGGARLIQLRMKGASDDELLREARLVKSICDRHNALFIVNDNALIARQVNADGVHLGKEDTDISQARQMLGNNKIIGGTCNTFEDVAAAIEKGADYAGIGPFRFTTTKKNLSPVLGANGYREITKRMREKNMHLPVFAIGGITSEDIPELMTCGVQGVALSSYIKNSGNIEKRTREIQSELEVRN